MNSSLGGPASGRRASERAPADCVQLLCYLRPASAHRNSICDAASKAAAAKARQWPCDWPWPLHSTLRSPLHSAPLDPAPALLRPLSLSHLRPSGKQVAPTTTTTAATAKATADARPLRRRKLHRGGSYRPGQPPRLGQPRPSEVDPPWNRTTTVHSQPTFSLGRQTWPTNLHSQQQQRRCRPPSQPAAIRPMTQPASRPLSTPASLEPWSGRRMRKFISQSSPAGRGRASGERGHSIQVAPLRLNLCRPASQPAPAALQRPLSDGPAEQRARRGPGRSRVAKG